MARPIDIDAPLSAGIRRNKTGKNFKRSPVKKASSGIKKRFGGAGKPSRRSDPVRGGGARRQSGGGIQKTNRTIPSNDNREVRVNLSNLAPTVLAEDLRQLFSEFGVKKVSVNYNEKGNPTGTGDLTVSKRNADRLVQKFAGVALDDKLLKFAIIDTTNMASRVKFPDTPQRVLKPVQRRSGNGKQMGSGPKKNVKAQKPKREAQPKKTIEELDAELDAYMAPA